MRFTGNLRLQKNQMANKGKHNNTNQKYYA